MIVSGKEAWPQVTGRQEDTGSVLLVAYGQPLRKKELVHKNLTYVHKNLLNLHGGAISAISGTLVI